MVSFGKASIADSNVSSQALLTTIKNKDIVDIVVDMQKCAYFTLACTTIQNLGVCKIKNNFKQMLPYSRLHLFDQQ